MKLDNIVNWNNVFKNSEAFQNSKPFPFGFIENFLTQDLYDELYNTYPTLTDKRWISVTSDFGRSAKRRWFGDADPSTERASVNTKDPILSQSWNDFFNYLHSKEFIENMSKYSGVKLKGFKHFSFMVNEKGSFNMPHTHHATEKKEDYARRTYDRICRRG